MLRPDSGVVYVASEVAKALDGWCVSPRSEANSCHMYRQSIVLRRKMGHLADRWYQTAYRE